MSKRKDIEYIHNVKGISYKEARRLYHDNGDDLIKSLGFDYEQLGEALSHIAEAAYKIGEAISEIVNNIDWEEVARAYNEAKRDLEDNSIEIPDNYFNEEEG